MHNYQNGTIVVSGGPYRALTKGNCAMCHTGSNEGLGSTTHVPHVESSAGEPAYRFNGTVISGSGTNYTLAGGSFYWREGNCGNGSDTNTGDVCVHDVDFFSSEGPYTPPGYDPNNYGRPQNWNKQLTCAGNYGCHGKFDPNNSTLDDPFAAISGAHHKNVRRDNGTAEPNDVYDSYRFLYGIKGTEDDNWEYDYDSTSHNGYYAVDLYGQSVSSPDVNSGSINYLCGECHGQFHWNSTTGSYGSPWLRHPTDIDMNHYIGTNKEYQNYPGPFDANGTYFPDVPVGTDDGSVVSTVWSSGKAIVLCISCHRAHGSPYADLLRWPYDACTCGNSTNSTTQCGCFACHTTK